MDEILEQFEALYLVYNSRFPLTGDALAKLASQYRPAMQDVTPDQFRRACEKWQYDRKGKRFPLPDEMAEMVELVRPREKVEGAQPWRPLDKSEYDQLSLRDKARHCLILAERYRQQAGPMFARGKGEGPVNVEAHSRFLPMAARCQAEAARLQALVAEAQNRDEPARLAVPRLDLSLPFATA